MVSSSTSGITVDAYSTENVATFSVANLSGDAEGVLYIECGGTAVVACTPDETSYYFAPNEVIYVDVTFDVGTSGGTLTLRAYTEEGAMEDIRSRNITVLPAPETHRETRRTLSAFDATVSYATPAYVSMDIPRSVALVYRASQARAMGMIQLDVLDTASTPAPKVSLKLRRVGASSDVTFTNGLPELYFTGGAGVSRIAGQFDATAESTSAPQYTATVRYHYPGGTVETSTLARILIINEKNSPFGAGWTAPGIQRLYPSQPGGGGALITAGDGSAAYFMLKAAGYAAPDGDFTTLTQRSSVGSDSIKYDRTYPNGTQVGFTVDGRMRRVRDRIGNATVYGYNTSGQLTTITDPAGKVITLAYTSGKLSSITGPNGRVTGVSINGSGDLVSITDPDNVVAMTATYASNHQMTSRTDRRGSHWGFAYDFAGMLAADTMPAVTIDGALVKPVMTYASLEKSVLVDPASGTGTSTTPATQRVAANLRASVTNPRGISTSWALDRFGGATRIEEPFGRVTIISRDSLGRVTRTISPSADTVDQTWVGPNLTRIVRRTLNDTTNFEYTGSFNGLRLVTTRTDTVQNWWSTTGLLDSTRVGRQTGSGLPASTEYRYDALGRDTVSFDPANHATRRFYAATGYKNTTQIRHGTRSTYYQHDGEGRVTSVQNPDGRTQVSAYDALNRQIRSIVGTDTTVYEFDSLYLRKVIDAKDQEYEFVRNALGWVEIEKRPAVTSDPLRKQLRFGYDVAGNLKYSINRRGDTVHVTYDSLNRPLTRSVNGQTTTHAYSPTDAWRAVSNAESTDTIKFDRAGRATAQVTIRGGTSYTLASEFDQQSRRTRIITPWDTVRYHFNAFALDSLTDLAGGVSRFTYSAGERLPTSIVLPTLPTPFTIDLDPLENHGASGTTYSDTSINASIGELYGYYGSGKLKVQVAANAASGTSYTYDAKGQLAEALLWTFPYAGSCVPESESGQMCDLTARDTTSITTFTYDAVGNRTDHGATTEAGNRLRVFDGDSLFYDDDGNLIRRRRNGVDTQRLHWNALGQLIATSDSVEFGYDGWGRRVRKWSTGGTTRYLLDGDQVYAELDAVNTLKAEYLHLPGVDRHHSVRRSGTVLYYAQDALGDVRGLIAADGSLAEAYSYSPFGETWALDTITNAMRYKGREFDTETGLYYNRARYYDPKLGRFISEDPIGLAGGVNVYVYAENDPCKYSDPTGLAAEGSMGEEECPDVLGKESVRAVMSGLAAVSGPLGLELGAWLAADGSGEYRVVSVVVGRQASIVPGPQPVGATVFVHTHPNAGAGWVQTMSPADQRVLNETFINNGAGGDGRQYSTWRPGTRFATISVHTDTLAVAEPGGPIQVCTPSRK